MQLVDYEICQSISLITYKSIYLANLDPTIGSEIKKTRAPLLLLAMT